MAIQGKCFGCGTLLQLPAEAAGRVAKCPKCGVSFKVPMVTGHQPAAAPAPPAPAAVGPAELSSTVSESQPVRECPLVTVENAVSDSAGFDMSDDDRFAGRRSAMRARAAGRTKTWRKVGLVGGCLLGVVVLAIAWTNWPRPRAKQNTVGAAKGNKAVAGKSTVGKKKKKEIEVAADEPESRQRHAASQENLTRLELADLIDRVDDGVVLITGLDSFGKPLTLGSGFIIDKSGLVATNFHVVSKATRIRVQFRDAIEVDVKGYRAYNPLRDLAILELAERPDKLEALVLAGDEDPRQGADVVAIGHPSGFKFTSTPGIVSGVHTTKELPEGVQAFLGAPADNVWIQTNAVISPGNSGGPLLNTYGQVIGINTWVARGTNLGFATHVKHLAAMQRDMFSEAMPLSVAAVPGTIEDNPLGKIDERVARLVNEYRRANEEFRVQMQKEPDESKQKAMFKDSNPVTAHAPKFLELAASDPGSEMAFQSLYLLCYVAKGAPAEVVIPFLKQAAEILARDQLQREQLADLVVVLAALPDESIRAFLKTVFERSPHRKVQGIAGYLLAESLLAESERQPALEAEALVLLERVVAEFGNVVLGDYSLAERAEPELFERKSLRPGQPAPEITGYDVDGREFKLSDYRGKVVLINFWADWSADCVQLYPYQRLLAEKHKDLPFVILGVCNDTRERLRTVVDWKQVTWRSWNDGRNGLITRKWNVHSLPTTYLIDHTGTIRFKNLKLDEMETAVIPLLKAAAVQ